MNNRNTHTRLLAIVLPALLLIGAACTNSQSTTNSTPTNSGIPRNQNTAVSEATVELANLGGVTFAAHNTTTGLAGDIRMSKTYLDAGAGRNVPVFLFGQPLPGRSTTQLNPNLEFGGLASAVTVVSAIDGVVGFVRQQADSNDYEVFVQPSEGSVWTLGYDHLTDVTVRQGERVTVGQPLGKAGRENNGQYRYELQVNKESNGVTTFHCPVELLRADVKAAQTTAIATFIQEWNTFYGSRIYGTYTAACAKPVLTLQETQ